MRITATTYKLPIGSIVLAATESGLCLLEFDLDRAETRKRLESRFGSVELQWLKELPPYTTALAAYLDGRVDALDSVAVDPGGTPFQSRVWRALRRIPAGRTASYRDIAQSIGNPGAVRAVGMANARNPVALVIPCHRIIRSDGDLGGYAGGLQRKQWLLQHEGAQLPLF